MRLRVFVAIVALIVSACARDTSTADPDVTIDSETVSESLADTELAAAGLERMRAIQDVGEVYLAISLRAPPDSPGATVDDFYGFMEENSREIAGVLDDFERAIDGLESFVDDVAGTPQELGVTEATLRQYIAAQREYLESHRFQNDPSLCRSALPENADSWAVSQFGSYEPWGECLLAFFDEPLVAQGFAAVDLAGDLGFEITSEWALAVGGTSALPRSADPSKLSVENNPYLARGQAIQSLGTELTRSDVVGFVGLSGTERRLAEALADAHEFFDIEREPALAYVAAVNSYALCGLWFTGYSWDEAISYQTRGLMSQGFMGMSRSEITGIVSVMADTAGLELCPEARPAR